MSGAIPPLLPSTYMACSGTALLLQTPTKLSLIDIFAALKIRNFVILQLVIDTVLVFVIRLRANLEVVMHRGSVVAIKPGTKYIGTSRDHHVVLHCTESRLKCYKLFQFSVRPK
jgi:hypothetical protein